MLFTGDSGTCQDSHKFVLGQGPVSMGVSCLLPHSDQEPSYTATCKNQKVYLQGCYSALNCTMPVMVTAVCHKSTLETCNNRGHAKQLHTLQMLFLIAISIKIYIWLLRVLCDNQMPKIKRETAITHDDPASCCRHICQQVQAR